MNLSAVLRRSAPGGRAGRVRLRPTAAGWGLLLLVGVLALMAINEANNLLYAMAFLIAALLGVSAVQGGRNVSGLSARVGTLSPMHAGQVAQAGLLLRNGGAVRTRHALRFALPLQTERPLPAAAMPSPPVSAPVSTLTWPGSIEAGTELQVDVAWAAPLRGWQRAERLEIESDHPLGLTRARVSLPVHAELLVWPRPAPADRDRPASRAAREASEADDFAGLTPWQAGDSPRRLAWKALAREGPPLVKRFDGAEGRQATLIDWADTAGDVEQRLAVITRRLLDAQAGDRDWLLRLPGQRDRAGSDTVAFGRALVALALFDAPGDSA